MGMWKLGRGVKHTDTQSMVVRNQSGHTVAIADRPGIKENLQMQRTLSRHDVLSHHTWSQVYTVQHYYLSVCCPSVISSTPSKHP